MQLRLDKNIFLYSKFHAVYTELDDAPNAATAIADLIGKPFFTLSERKVTSCAAALILQRTADLHELCEFHLLHGAKPRPQIMRIDVKHIFIAGISSVQLDCTDQDAQSLQVEHRQLC